MMTELVNLARKNKVFEIVIKAGICLIVKCSNIWKKLIETIKSSGVFGTILIIIDAFCHSFFHKEMKEENVLIVFQQAFGDAIVISNSLAEYQKIYPQEKGYKVCFISNPSVNKFMHDVLTLPDELSFEEVDFKRFVKDYKYYKEVKNTYCRNADIVIVPGSSLSADIFSSSCKTKKRIGLVFSMKIQWPPIQWFFSRVAYSEIVRPNKELMMLQRHRLLLNYLGDKSFKSGLPVILTQKKFINEEKYAVLCPGASKMEKCWPTERYVEIINYIVDKYKMRVHLCGGADEKEFEDKIISAIANKNMVESHIGKTSFVEWASIVQYADIVVGNDSATMHLAAASQREAICIAGVYDKYQFFPYKVDILKDSEHLPITMIKDMSCEWCRTKGYYSGYGNAICSKQIKAGKCALCIEKISVQEVKNEIDSLLQVE